MTNIEATAVRDNGWWVAEFTVDGREYGTQAKRLDQLETMIKDAASLMTVREPKSFQVDIELSGIPVDAVTDYKEASVAVRSAEQRLSSASRRAVQQLTEAGLTMRDVGAIMGVSVQRVSQLAKS